MQSLIPHEMCYTEHRQIKLSIFITQITLLGTHLKQCWVLDNFCRYHVVIKMISHIGGFFWVGRGWSLLV